ncbi:MAG: ACT domain-containing protein [Victivallaceae bacterium]|nr:ACT domain-containing protein [Victivallaceae bacterium]
MKKVLIPTKLDTFAAKLLRQNGFEVVQDADRELNVLVAENSDAAVLIVRSEKITADIIDALPKLKLVVRAGAGYNTIDTKYARRKNIDVMNTPGANSNAVAEEVIAMILGASRHLVRGDITTRNGEWQKKNLMGRELTGKTIGILGLGNIGQLVSKRLQGFEMKFLGYDPMISASMAEQLDIELCSMEEIFSQSDFISLHIPENDETRGIINCKYFDMMKDGAMLVNCARAGVINEDDLRAAKQDKKIIFCNDVYAKDAAGDKSVADIADLMLPHLGASTVEANFNAAKRAAEQSICYFDQGITDCVVNKDIPDGLDANYQRLANLLTGIAHGYLGQQKQPVRIESSFYGNLNQYAKWMLSPITAALSPDFDPYLDAGDAESFLSERGIEYKNREISNDKNYGDSITIDLFMGDEVINKVSVRGTLTEGNLMVSRINNFDRLYLAPSGHNLFVEYSDEPGIIGKIAGILGENDINIIDIRAPQDLKINRSLASVKTDVPVDEDLLAKIKISVGANIAFCYSCKS